MYVIIPPLGFMVTLAGPPFAYGCVTRFDVSATAHLGMRNHNVQCVVAPRAPSVLPYVPLLNYYRGEIEGLSPCGMVAFRWGPLTVAPRTFLLFDHGARASLYAWVMCDLLSLPRKLCIGAGSFALAPGTDPLVAWHPRARRTTLPSSRRQARFSRITPMIGFLVCPAWCCNWLQKWSSWLRPSLPTRRLPKTTVACRICLALDSQKPESSESCGEERVMAAGRASRSSWRYRADVVVVRCHSVVSFMFAYAVLQPNHSSLWRKTASLSAGGSLVSFSQLAFRRRPTVFC